MSGFNLENKLAIITGGASGIGKSISKVFAKHGAIVHIIDVSEHKLADTVAEIKQESGDATGHLCDISDQQKVLEIVNTIRKTHPISILINNAGVAQIGNVEQTSEEDLDHIYNINIKGVYNLIYACIPHMKNDGGGVILNMASVVATIGVPDRFAYSMSKGAVLTMTYSVAKDYIHDNIRCNSISPARVHTPFVDGYLAKTYPGKEKEMFDKLSKTQPIGRMAKSEEIAYLALYLCSDQAGFITGTDYPIDGGFTHLNN